MRHGKPLSCRLLDGHQRGGMAAGVGVVMLVRTRRTIRLMLLMPVVAGIVAMAILAMRRGGFHMDMLHGENATGESGDHAEHQQPCPQPAHAAEEALILMNRKRNLPSARPHFAPAAAPAHFEGESK